MRFIETYLFTNLFLRWVGARKIHECDPVVVVFEYMEEFYSGWALVNERMGRNFYFDFYGIVQIYPENNSQSKQLKTIHGRNQNH